jgi:hypothetical protein
MSARKKFLVKPILAANVISTLPITKQFDGAPLTFDLFIGACGFEERVLAAPKLLYDTKSKINKIALGTYNTNPDDNLKRQGELLPILKKLNNDVSFFEADSPEDIYRTISSSLSSVNDSSRITVGIDISGGSATFITSVLLSLIRLDKDLKLVIFYTTAAIYHSPQEKSRNEPVSLWSDTDLRERGVLDVSANELAPGIQHDHFPNYAIALPSMFPARLQRSLSFLGIGTLGGVEKNVFWILPKTDDAQHKWRQSQVKLSLIEMIYGKQDQDTEPNPSDQFLPNGQYEYCDVLSYTECLRIIMDQSQKNPNSNISIIHAGTKIQAVGTALAIAARPEIALIKARPQAFSADNYSQGIGETFTICFENLQEACKSLAKIGQFEIENN